MEVCRKTINFAPEIKLKATQIMDKIKVSQDVLYKFLQERNITNVVIAQRMGVSESIVGGSFRHALNRHGKPLSFSEKNIVKLNEALQMIANELRQCVITFGSDDTNTNKRGSTYVPCALEGFHKLDTYFNVTKLTKRVLGWDKSKRDMILSCKSSVTKGNITVDDVNRINAELLAVAGVLGSYEVVADEPKD